MTMPVLTKPGRALPVLVAITLFALGLIALDHLMDSVEPAAVMLQIRSTPPGALALSVAATAIGYAALVGYDALALRFIGKALPARNIAMGGFLGYAFGNTIGMSVVSGGAVRYRFYSAFGLDAFEVVAVSGYIAAALGAGLALVGLAALGLHPEVVSHTLTLAPDVIRFGALAIFLASVGIILALSAGNRQLRLWRLDLRLPSPQILARQLALSLVDVSAAAFALWILMPVGTPSLGAFIAIYAVAMMVGVVSHVPGGVGVFETVVIAALPVSVPVSEAAAALVLFRIVYYLLPFAIGFVVVSLSEARFAGGLVGRLAGGIPAALRPAILAVHGFTPSLAGLVTFGFGAYLLLVSLSPTVRSDALADGDFVAAILIEGGTLLSAMVGHGQCHAASVRHARLCR